MKFRGTCLLLSALLYACAREPQEAKRPPADPPSTPPASSVQSEPVGGIVTWAVPSEWLEEPVAPGGPIAKFRLPRYDEQDPEDGRVWVYHFGRTSTQHVDSLVDLTYQEFTPAGGGSARDAARTFGGVFNELSHRFAELSGTYAPRDGAEKPGYDLLTAVVQTKSGPYFVKAIGPERTIDYFKSDFYSFMSSFAEVAP